MGFFVIGLCYVALFSTLGANKAVAYVKDTSPHHVIFDDLGKMSTGVTYINIAIPLNLTLMFQQIKMFDQYLDTIIKKNNINMSANLGKLSDKDKGSIMNMDQLIKHITAYSKKRLQDLSYSLQSVDNLLPVDPSYDKDNERHKRFVLILAPLLQACKLGNYDLNDRLNNVTKELDMYKLEYARLYDETLPELIPEYVEDNYDAMTAEELDNNVEFLTKTKRDIKFLMNIINLNGTHPHAENVTEISTTTPNPFWNFTHLFSNIHKPRNINSTFMIPERLNSTSPIPKILSKTEHKERTKYLQYLRQQTGQPPKSQIPTPINADLEFTQANFKRGNFTETAYSIRRREKRFLPAVAIAVGALGTFLGIFNKVEIDNIRRDMANLQNNQNLLIQVTKIHTNQINALQNGLTQLNDIFDLFIKNNPALLYAKFNDVLTSLSDRINDLKDTIQMLQLQRLSTSTLNSFQITKLYEEITQLAKFNNLLPLTNKPQDLFQLDTSYVRINNEILVIIHVPCSNPSSLLTIYKYVPFPIPVTPQPHLNLTVLSTIQDVFDISSPRCDKATEGIHFTADADLIAIGKNDKGRHRYILLSSPEMSACTKRSQAYICERHQVTKSDLLGSCLGSLYLQSPHGVASNCKINRIPLKETVYQISNTNHIVFSPNPITTQISCNNGSYFPLKIKNTQQIRIPEGCQVELINHTITSDFSIRTTSDSIHFEWDFDPISLPNSALLMVDAKSIDSKLSRLRNNIDYVHKEGIHADAFQKLLETHFISGSWISTLFIVCFVISVILVLITAAVCFRNYLLKGGWIGQKQQQSQRPPDYTVGYHRGRRNSEDEDELIRMTRSDVRRLQEQSMESQPPLLHLVPPSAPDL